MKFKFIIIFLTVSLAYCEGVVEWTKVLCDTTEKSDVLTSNCLAKTADGGFIVSTSSTRQFTYKTADIGVYKLNSAGDLEWNKLYQGLYLDRGVGITQKSNEEYYMICQTNSYNSYFNLWLYNLNSAGDSLWTKLLLNNYDDFANDVEELPDGGCVVVGNSGINDNSDPDKWIIRFDSAGNIIWSNTYGKGDLVSVILNSDGEICTIGRDVNGKIYFLKINIDGSIISEKSYNSGTGAKIVQSESCTYAIAATSGTLIVNSNGEVKFWLAEETGNKLYGSEVTSDGGYLFTGLKYMTTGGSENFYIKKCDADGAIEWEDTIGEDDTRDGGFDVVELSPGNYIACGRTKTYATEGNEKLLIAKYQDNTISSVENESGVTVNNCELLQNYPNPFNPNTTIRFFNQNTGSVKLSVYNMKGELVQNLVNKNMQAGNHSINFNASNLNSGVYYYTLQTAEKSITKKMIMIK